MFVIKYILDYIVPLVTIVTYWIYMLQVYEYKKYKNEKFDNVSATDVIKKVNIKVFYHSMTQVIINDLT